MHVGEDNLDVPDHGGGAHDPAHLPWGGVGGSLGACVSGYDDGGQDHGMIQGEDACLLFVLDIRRVRADVVCICVCGLDKCMQRQLAIHTRTHPDTHTLSHHVYACVCLMHSCPNQCTHLPPRDGEGLPGGGDGQGAVVHAGQGGEVHVSLVVFCACVCEKERDRVWIVWLCRGVRRDGAVQRRGVPSSSFAAALPLDHQKPPTTHRPTHLALRPKHGELVHLVGNHHQTWAAAPLYDCGDGLHLGAGEDLAGGVVRAVCLCCVIIGLGKLVKGERGKGWAKGAYV